MTYISVTQSWMCPSIILFFTFNSVSIHLFCTEISTTSFQQHFNFVITKLLNGVQNKSNINNTKAEGDNKYELYVIRLSKCVLFWGCVLGEFSTAVHF